VSLLLYGEKALEISVFKGTSLSGVRQSVTRVVSLYGKEIKEAKLIWSGHTWTMADVWIYVNKSLVAFRWLSIPCWTDKAEFYVTDLIGFGDNEISVVVSGGATFDLSLSITGEELTWETKPPEERLPAWLYVVVGVAIIGAVGYATGAFAKLAEAIKRR